MASPAIKLNLETDPTDGDICARVGDLYYAYARKEGEDGYLLHFFPEGVRTFPENGDPPVRTKYEQVALWLMEEGVKCLLAVERSRNIVPPFDPDSAEWSDYE